MISLGIKYPNINAKLKGMYSKRITKEDLEDIIKQSSLKNTVLLLKTKSEIFKNVDENIDRLEIESLLESSQIKDIKKIINLLDKKDKEVFKLFLLQYEIKCIKSMIRKLFSEDKTNDIIAQNVKMWTDNLFDDIKGIETVQSFDEFFMAIKRMKYSKIFEKYQGQKNINLFEVENQIDKKYFEILYDKVKSVKSLQTIVGSEIDLLNVLWIYRIKKYYNLEKEDLKNIIINKNYKLNNNIINKLIETNSFDDIKIIMQNTVYKKVFISEADFENNIDKYLYKVNKKVFEQDFKTSAYIYAYVNLTEYENNDIINAIEGIRYNMEKQEIKRRIVR